MNFKCNNIKMAIDIFNKKFFITSILTTNRLNYSYYSCIMILTNEKFETDKLYIKY